MHGDVTTELPYTQWISLNQNVVPILERGRGMRLSGSFQYSIKKSVNLEASSHTQPSYKPKIVSAGRPVSCQKHPAGLPQLDSLLFWTLWRRFPSLLASSSLTACTAEMMRAVARWRLLLTHLHGNDTNPPRPRQLRMRTLASST